MTRSRAGGSLLLLDFSCDPEVITEALGLVPTKSWKKGDVGPRASMKRIVNGWKLESRLAPDRKIAEHVEDIIAQLSPAKDRLMALQLGGRSTFFCHLYVEGDERPEVYLPAPLVKFIGDIGASFGLDNCYFPSTEPDTAPADED